MGRASSLHPLTLITQRSVSECVGQGALGAKPTVRVRERQLNVAGFEEWLTQEPASPGVGQRDKGAVCASLWDCMASPASSGYTA